MKLSDAVESSDGITCGYLYLDEEKTLTVEVGSAETRPGISVCGNMQLDENSVPHVASAAPAEESYGIECDGNITVKENATIHAESVSDNAGIVCCGVFLDYGANIDSLNGIQNMKDK